MSEHLDLPSDLDPRSAEFIPRLNDALRRLAGFQAVTSTPKKASTRGGVIITPSVAPAPNLTDATAKVTVAGGSYQFNGQITLAADPTGDAVIRVVCVDITDAEHPVDREVCTLWPPFVGSAVMQWASPLFAQPTQGSPLLFRPEFRVYNSADVLATPVITKDNLTVPLYTPGTAMLPPDITQGDASAWGQQAYNGFQMGVTGHFTTPNVDEVSAIAFVRVTRTGPDSDTQVKEVAIIEGPFTKATTYPYKGTADEWLDRFNAHSWAVTITPYNADFAASANPLDLSVTFTPVECTAVTAVDEGPRVVDDPVKRGVMTTIRVTPAISKPGITGGTQVTTWIRRGSNAPRVCLGWKEVNDSRAYIDFDGQYVSIDQTQTTWDIWCFPSWIPGEDYPGETALPAGTQHTTVTVAAADPQASWVTGARLTPDPTTGKLVYGPGNWRPNSMVLNAPFSTQSDLKQVLYYVQEGTVDGAGNFTARDGDPTPRNFASGVQGIDAQEYQWPDPWSMPPTTSWTGRAGEKNCFKLTITAQSRKVDSNGNELETIQTGAWPTGAGPTPVAGVTYYAAYAIVIPDPSLGAASPAPGVPAALSVTATVSDTQIGGLPYFTVAGLVTLNTTGQNYAQTRGIRVRLRERNVDLDRTAFSTPPITWNYSGPPLPKPTINQTLNVDVYTSNADGVEAGPTTQQITVTAATGNLIPPPGTISVDSVTVAEVGTRPTNQTRLADGNSKVSLLVTIVPHSSSYGVQNYSAWYSQDGGATFVWSGWFALSGASATFALDKIVPAADKSVQVWVAPGAYTGDPTTYVPRASLPTNGSACSTNYSFLKAPAPTASAIATAVIGTVSPSTDPDGKADWQLNDITITPGTTDPNAFYWQLWVYICNAAGTRASDADGGQDALVGMGDFISGAYHVGSVAGWGFPADGTKDRARFYLKVISVSGLSTVQSTCWSGLAYGDAVFGGTPVGNIDVTRARTSSVGHFIGTGVKQTDNTARFDLNSRNLGTSILADWDFELSKSGSMGTPGNTGWGVQQGWDGDYPLVMTDGGYNGLQYCRLKNRATGIIQRVGIVPGEPVYVSIAARQSTYVNASAILTVYTAWLDASGAYIGGYYWVSANVVGSITGNVSSWKANAVTNVMTPPSGASQVELHIETSSQSYQVGSVWDVDAIIVRQVPQQQANNRTATMAPNNSSGDYSSLYTYSGIDHSSSTYGQGLFQLIAPDGSSYVKGSVSPGSSVLQAMFTSNPLDANATKSVAMYADGSTCYFILTRAGLSYPGVDLTFRDQAGVLHTVKGGIVVG